MQSALVEPGCLYVIATPIGNRADWSARAPATLAEVDWIACEDTRSFHRLTSGLDQTFPSLVLYRDDNEKSIAEKLTERLEAGESGAIITDAGTPGVSDPGFRIVRACHQKGIPVRAVPGPSALTAFLSIAGIPTDAFLFLGFLPPKSARRRTTFKEYENFPHTIIFYESVHRIEKFMDDLLTVLPPDRIVSYGRELTKQHETLFTGTLEKAREHILQRARKGEFVIGLAPAAYTL